MTPLEAMQRVIKGDFVEGFPMKFPPGISLTIGFQPIAIDKGSATFRLDASVDKHGNPMGTVHGGVFCDLADAAMGMACASLLAEGESFTTLELKMNFLRPVRDAALEARAKAVYGGKAMAYLECEVFVMPEEKLVAKASSTCLILRGDAARGR